MLTHGVFFKNILQHGFTSVEEAEAYIRFWAKPTHRRFFSVRELSDADRALFNA